MRKQSRESHRSNSPESVSSPSVNRRDFIKATSLAAGALAFGVPTLLRGQNLNSKLNIASIGIGGKGKSDTDTCAGENIVAPAQFDERIPRNHYGQDGKPNHAQEWLTAIKENKPELCYSRFEIASRLTEIMLLGCVSLRVGKKIEWDGPKRLEPRARRRATSRDRSPG